MTNGIYIVDQLLDPDVPLPDPAPTSRLGPLLTAQFDKLINDYLAHMDKQLAVSPGFPETWALYATRPYIGEYWIEMNPFQKIDYGIFIFKKRPKEADSVLRSPKQCTCLLEAGATCATDDTVKFFRLARAPSPSHTQPLPLC